MSAEITLKNPLDMHIHLREGAILEAIAPCSAQNFSVALAMPNLKNPITTTKMALDYKKAILDSAKNESFLPLISLYLTENLNRFELETAKKNSIKILKLYPKGATTGSESGVAEILNQKTLEIFEIAQNLGFILSIHGESNGFCLDREYEFGKVFSKIARNFPHLTIIMEHLSDRRSIALLERYPNLFATLTLHHIALDLDCLAGGAMNPPYFCKPILKTPRDREALLNLALSAHPKVSFGSDSAPHLQSAKLKGAAGIFSAPVLLPKLCEIFEAHNRLENLQKFISDNAMKIYGLDSVQIPQKSVILERIKCILPSEIRTQNESIKILFGGESCAWQIKEIKSHT